MIAITGAVVVAGVVWLPEGPADDGVDDGVIGICSDVNALDPEVTIRVDDGPAPMPIVLEFELEPKDKLELCEVKGDEGEDLLCEALTPVFRGEFVLPVGMMLFWDGDPEMLPLPEPVPKRLEVTKDD